MKLTKIFFSLKLLFIFTNASLAHSHFSCEVKTLSSICGDGKIKLDVDDNLGFKLSYGDISCWYHNLKFEGSLVFKQMSKYPYYNSEVYTLTGRQVNDHSPENREIAQIIIDKKAKVAKIEFVKNEVLLFTGRDYKYLLQCQLKEDLP